MQECVLPYLNDTEDAWQLENSGQYQLVSQDKTTMNTFSAQKRLIQQYAD
jgi:hypothetical protein